MPLANRNGSLVMTWRKRWNVFCGTNKLAMPVSSSSEMKQWPLAVPGRWRDWLEAR